jgi:carboxylesterase type B
MEIVHTKYGEISGLKGNGYTVYKGIPYAKPPIG